jgi:hypothetical protein
LKSFVKDYTRFHLDFAVRERWALVAATLSFCPERSCFMVVDRY